MSHTRYTFNTEIGTEIRIVTDSGCKTIKELSTDTLETLAADIHVELLERDDSYFSNMDDRNIADD